MHFCYLNFIFFHIIGEFHYQHCKRGFVILTIIFLTRVATVDMVLWKDTRIVPHGNQLWAIQCTWSSSGTIKFATKAGKIAWTSDKCCMQQKGIVPSQRSLSCELRYNCSIDLISMKNLPCNDNGSTFIAIHG